MIVLPFDGGCWAMLDAPEWNRGKFKQLILLLAQRSAEDPWFGAVKLNKLLYFCDFEAFRLFGQPMTGARYQKEEFGPLATAMLPIQDQMIGDGQIEIVKRRVGGHNQAVTVAIHSPDISRFTADELGVVAEVLDRLHSMDATDASEYSHEASSGWRTVDMHDPIPYVSALFERRVASPEAIEKTQAQLVARYGG